MLTAASTPPVEVVPLPIGPEARTVMGTLAVEHAQEVLDVDWSNTALALHHHRHALRVVARQLAQAMSEKVDDRPPPCGGTGALVPEDAVDGSGVATCPTCRRFRLATHLAGQWWVIDRHPSRHLPGCVQGPIRCVCALRDNTEPF